MGRNTVIGLAVGAIAIGVFLYITGFFCKYRATSALCNPKTQPGHARTLEENLTRGGKFVSPTPTGNAPIPEGSIMGLGHNYTGAQYQQYINKLYGGM